MTSLLPKFRVVITQIGNSYSNLLPVTTRRCFSLSLYRRGFEEFFPAGVYNGDNYVEEDPVVGRRWKASELRIRSSVDLHKFWYVLLKENNMLLTLEHECKRLGIPMPGPTRIHKVKQSMNLVETVIKEREQAIMELEKEREYKFDKEDVTKDIVTTVENENIDSKLHTEENSNKEPEKQKSSS